MSDTIDSAVSYQGYYGKAPAHGDFISRGLPGSFRDPWDIWLQSVMHATRTELAENWSNYYLICPAYHFALSPGICGRQSWIGVMIPSVDQVGRCYPMTLCRSVPQDSDLFSAAVQYQQWFTDAETLVLSCLDENFILTDFDNRLDQLGLSADEHEEDDATHLQHTVQEHPQNAWRMTAMNPAQAQIHAPLLNAVLKKYTLSFSLFWTAGSDVVLPSTIISQGLPPVDGSSALLDGNWNQWGWKNPQVMDCFTT